MFEYLAVTHVIDSANQTANSVVDRHPRTRDEDVAGKVVENPELRLGDGLSPVEIRRDCLELRRRRRSVEADLLASLRQVRRSDAVARGRTIGRGRTETLSGGHRKHEPQAVGKHVVDDERTTPRDDRDRRRTAERAGRYGHREVCAGERKRGPLWSDHS